MNGQDACNEPLTYAIVLNPAHGQVTAPSGSACVYTPTETNFTGTDTFMYRVTTATGESATNVIPVTVGDNHLYGNWHYALTTTNTPVAITFTGGDGDSCVESNSWTYSVTLAPANGRLTGSGANFSYTPNPNFEGTDSIQFTASDGIWKSSPAVVTIYVVGAAHLSYLNGYCDPFGGSAALQWTEDSATTALLQAGLDGDTEFVISRSTNPVGPFSMIATNSVGSSWMYSDITAVPGQTYYYALAVSFTDNSDSAHLYQSAFSNTNGQTAQGSDLIAPTSRWYITDWNEAYPKNIYTNQPVLTFYTNSPNLATPVCTNWVSGPFAFPLDYAAVVAPKEHPPLPPAFLNAGWTWTNAHTIWAHCELNLTGYTPQQLSNVVYSTAIDNGYLLYINGTNVNQNSSKVYWNGAANWGDQSETHNLFSQLPYVVAGTNRVDVIFWGDLTTDYFSMIVTTNTCGW